METKKLNGQDIHLLEAHHHFKSICSMIPVVALTQNTTSGYESSVTSIR
jgi:hypothetical protein